MSAKKKENPWSSMDDLPKCQGGGCRTEEKALYRIRYLGDKDDHFRNYCAYDASRYIRNTRDIDLKELNPV